MRAKDIFPVRPGTDTDCHTFGDRGPCGAMPGVTVKYEEGARTLFAEG